VGAAEPDNCKAIKHGALRNRGETGKERGRGVPNSGGKSSHGVLGNGDVGGLLLGGLLLGENPPDKKVTAALPGTPNVGRDRNQRSSRAKECLVHPPPSPLSPWVQR
jgi:hypothetical protein